MDSCKMCKGDFHNSPDNLVFCEHHEGFVHNGCCTTHCSMDGKPCIHCKNEYLVVKKQN
jgi:hypothetical protein